MIVTAALSWWNEQPNLLRDCVAGIATVADRLIALDGAYRRFPGATARSDDAQVEAIRETAAAAGLDYLILQPDRTWTGEIEKRSALMTLAALKSDWIFIVDADHVILDADRWGIRGELLTTDADVLEVTFTTPEGGNDGATNWHRRQIGAPTSHPLIMRALPGLQVERRHWWYSAVKDGVRSWLWSEEDSYPHLPHGILQSHYVVEHRCLLRSESEMLATRGWYNDRVMVVERTGQEDDRPDLPAPVYDYQTVPY